MSGAGWEHSRTFPYNGASGRPYPEKWSQLMVFVLVTPDEADADA